jgi:Ulp1 family protease
MKETNEDNEASKRFLSTWASGVSFLTKNTHMPSLNLILNSRLDTYLLKNDYHLIISTASSRKPLLYDQVVSIHSKRFSSKPPALLKVSYPDTASCPSTTPTIATRAPSVATAHAWHTFPVGQPTKIDSKTILNHIVRENFGQDAFA